MLQHLNAVDDSCESTRVKEKGGYFEHKLTFQFISDKEIGLLT